jgi:hypothetical protein
LFIKFSSVMDEVECALEIQRRPEQSVTRPRRRMRIVVHVRDVLVVDGDRFGDDPSAIALAITSVSYRSRFGERRWGLPPADECREVVRADPVAESGRGVAGEGGVAAGPYRRRAGQPEERSHLAEVVSRAERG